MTTEVVGAKRGFRIGRWALHLVIAIILIMWLVPTIGTLINSFRTETAVRFDGWWNALAPPYDFTLESYRHVLTRQGMGDAFINSLIITIPGTIIPIAVASFAAYAFAWMKFPFRNRSEERRVGKEGRSRWTPDHCKNDAGGEEDA